MERVLIGWEALERGAFMIREDFLVHQHLPWNVPGMLVGNVTGLETGALGIARFVGRKGHGYEYGTVPSYPSNFRCPVQRECFEWLGKTESQRGSERGKTGAGGGRTQMVGRVGSALIWLR